MKSKQLILFVFFLFIFKVLVAQKSNYPAIIFHPVFNNSTLHLEDTFYKLNENDSIQFETFKFYISGIEFLNDGKIVWLEENSFHLIDVSEEKSLQVFLQTPSNISFNTIKFNLGIDSITNVSGAMGGDLDPTKGMYWTWQNGYINFKLEGKSNLCKTRKNEFQFHIGGYQYPFNAVQAVSLIIIPKKTIDINIDLKNLINEIDLTNENQLMLPGKEAILFSKKATAVFSVQLK